MTRRQRKNARFLCKMSMALSIIGINQNLMWVGAAAYGAAWLGYNREKLNAADAVEQIMRIKQFDKNIYAIEFWRRNRQSTYILHNSDYQKILDSLNNLIKAIKND